MFPSESRPYLVPYAPDSSEAYGFLASAPSGFGHLTGGYAVSLSLHPNALATFLLANAIILPMIGEGTSHTRWPLNDIGLEALRKY